MSLSVSRIKLSHQVKKAIQSLGVTNVSDTSIDLIFEHLSLTNRDYALEPKRLLTDAIRDIMSTTLPNKATTDSVRSSTSLNQSLLSMQKERGIASKRSRPVDEDQVVSDQVAEGEGVPSTSTSTTAEVKEKKKKNNISATVHTATLDALYNKATPATKGMNFLAERPKVRFSDLAGLDVVVKQIQELVCYPIQYPQLYEHLGVCPPCGILLHGPSGCGKTTLAASIAGETGLPYFKVSGPELVGGTSGESEERIRQVFEAAAAAAPSVLFIDALDVIAGKKDVRFYVERVVYWVFSHFLCL